MPGTMRRDLVIGVDAETGKAEKGFDRTKRGASSYERELRKLERQQAKVDAAMDKVGKGMLVAGAAIAAGLGLAVKAAIDWETSWAGVLKTVDGTDEQMAALEEEIRGLTAVLPASHAEIAAVAEAAGQLGVQRDNVAGFTKTMIDMGEATNLAATDAATALARMMNIMQTAPGDVDRLGSAIVELGNTSATTEAEIVEMALRISGAGNQIGLTEAEVLAFSATLSSVGIRAEAGGTAISKVFLEIDTAVRNGGDALDVFAETAGMTAAEFQQAYERDAAGAIQSFVAGLGRVQERGGDVNAVLDQLGLTEIRVSDALRRMSGAGDLLSASLDRSTAAWDENTALVEEAERRYGTVEARLGIARNQVNDFAIDIGQTFLPMVGEMAGGLGELADIIGGLPGPLRATLGVLAAVTAALLLAGGTALIAVPKIHAFRTSLDTIAGSSARAAAAVGAFRASTSAITSFLGGPWGIALGAAVVAVTAFATSQAQARGRAQEFTDTLDQQTGAVTDDTRALIAHKLEEQGALEIAQRHGIELTTLVDAVMGNVAARSALTQAVRDNAEMTEIHGQGISKESGEIVTMDEVVQQLTGDLDAGTEAWARETEAVGGATEATREMEPATRDLADAFGVSADAADDVADAVDDLDGELQQLFDRVFGLQNAEDDLADAFDALTEQIQQQREAGVKGAGSLEGMSEAARENRDLAQELLEKYGALTLETIKTTGSQEEAEAVAKRFKGQLEELAEQTGVNVEDLEGYNDVVAEIERLIEVTFGTPELSRVERNVRNLKHAIDRIPRNVGVHFAMSTSGTAPVGSGRIAFQHGGEIEGPSGIDRVPIAATAGEIIIRRPVAQMHREQLLALNRTGRFPVHPGGQMGALPPIEFRYSTRGTEFDRVVQDIVERGLRTNTAFRKIVHEA